MNVIRFLFIVCSGLLFSCASYKAATTSPDFSLFEADETLNEQPIQQMNGIAADGLLLLNDTLLAVRNQSGSSTTHFTIWNLNQKRISGYRYPAGRKEGQVTGFMSYGVSKNNFWVNDILKEKFFLQNIDGPAGNTRPVDYKLPGFYYWVALANDSTVLAGGDYDSDYKIAMIDLPSGKVVDQMLPYKLEKGPPLLREQKMAYENFLFLKPSGEKCVLACRYADQIEIVDLKSKTSKIIRGPEGYLPDVLVAVGNDGKKLSTRNDKTRYAFLSGKTTDAYIYLLYSGNNHLSNHLNYGSCLYVFDWSGRPVKKLNFIGDVLDFAVTRDDKTIYAYHPESQLVTVATVSGSSRK